MGVDVDMLPVEFERRGLTSRCFSFNRSLLASLFSSNNYSTTAPQKQRFRKETGKERSEAMDILWKGAAKIRTATNAG